MKFGVVIFPGSNCDHDVLHVLSTVMGWQVEEFWHKQKDLNSFNITDCIILPGGFSYGDYLRAGAIARFSPIMGAVIEFAKQGGYVWGICNGFQILCEAHLLPGALLRNQNQKFISKNVNIKASTTNSPLTAQLDSGRSYKMPIAHAEGRFYADSQTLVQLKKKDCILFQYCTPEGVIIESANPNGSVLNIAGICNEDRNVFGMMPHPERASEMIIGNEDGKYLFQSIFNTTVPQFSELTNQE